MRAVIETGNIQQCGKVITGYSIRVVHSIGYGTCRIFAVADVLQKTVAFGSVERITLLRNFVAHTPHHHRSIIAVMMHQINHILFSPVVPEEIIPVSHLGCFPFVETFGHDHHPHFVAGANQFRSGHIVRCADGIHSHIFHDTNLTSNGSIVYSSTERSQIVVITYTLEYRFHSIEIKSVVGFDFDGANSKSCGIFIHQFTVGIKFGDCLVECRGGS